MEGITSVNMTQVVLQGEGKDLRYDRYLSVTGQEKVREAYNPHLPV